MVEKVADYAIYMLNVDGTIATWNAGARRFKGYLDHEIIGQHFSRFYSEQDQRSGLPARALQAAREHGSFEAEGWRVRKDGTRFWASVVIDALRDDDGELLGFAKITRDIDEKRAARVALQESENRFRLLVQGVTDYAIYMLSPGGVITNWNSGAERIKGYAADEVIGTHFSRFYSAEDQVLNEPKRALDTATQYGRFEAEGWRIRKDGTKFRAHVIIDAIRDDQGQLIGFAKVTRDITQRLEMEGMQAALQHSQRLESVGKLTGGVAHDFNNILQVVGSNLELLMLDVAGRAPALRHVEAALQAVKRGAKLSSQLLAFARRQPLQPVVLNVGRTLSDSEELLQRALGESIAVETVVADGLWNTVLDPHQLENVLLNLAINARDAMPDGGKLTIEAGNAVLDDAYVAATPDIPAGQYVVVSVSDTGCGMTADVLERAVEPFFTTKAEGRGTGLGLSMVFGFIKQSGGHFRLYSEVGHGTTVRMYFVRSHASDVTVPEPAGTDVKGGSETILVVEDDPAVQSVVVDVLRSFGYQVLKADNPDTALAVLRAGVRCDLLFTDVVMPGTIKSTELAQQAKALLPDLKILFTSGYTQNAIIHGGRLDPGVHLLSKPYRREQLAHKVRQLLSEANPVAPASAAQLPLASKRVLLIEDDEDALQVTVDSLEMLGCDVCAIASAEAAMPLLETRTFDVLLTDIHLPGMDGLALAHRLRRQQPDLKLVFVSGDSRVGGEVRQLGGSFLCKPFTLAALRTALQ
ncbi:PAS domain S-box protein [Duganella sp. BJB475]|uniref:hybrid sensor histidine kinase/response regulator n=1 Tax=unclassified Duganella TaxID=2636909 RepID=UPI000E353013|nr:PAS domain S-box protein [Duganella sp. BJB475]RFP31424.1 PAS domain S-box protein [Duganella sp. BJB476]